MLPAPGGPLLAGVEALLVAGLLLVLGWLVADALLGRGREVPVAWALAFAGLCLYALALMLLHVATAGSIFSSAWLTRGLTAATFVALAVRKWLLAPRAPRRSERGPTPWVPAILVAAGLVVWCSPVVRMLPLPPGEDMTMHAGWATQLLNGEPTPSGFVTGDIPNYYPWLFHALAALVATFTPGGRVLHALAPIQLLQVTGVVLTLFAVGGAIGRRATAGAASAVLGALTGGLGFVMMRHLDIVMNPRVEGLRYMGDLLFKRSYNASFYNLVPTYPRDVAFTLMVGSILLLVLGLKERRSRMLVGAGVVLGLTGLAGAESFLLGLGVAACVTLIPIGVSRARLAWSLFLPAVAIYATWLVPQIVSYVRLDGYRNLTVVGPVALPPLAILVSWGIVTPLAVYGALNWVPRARHEPGARVLLSMAAVAAAVTLASTAIPALFGDAFVSLGRAHRYWPLLYLAAALYSALGISEVLARIAPSRLRHLALVAGTVAAVASPLLASLALPDEFRRVGLIGNALRGDEDALLNLVAPMVGARCAAAVPVSIDGPVFAYTGYRLVMYTPDNPHPGDFARIRWRGIYDTIVPRQERLADNVLLVEGLGTSRRRTRAAQRYGVDVVVASSDPTAGDALDAEHARLTPDDWPFPVYRLSVCGISAEQ